MKIKLLMKGIIPQGKPWTRSRSYGSRSAASRGVLNLAFPALIREWTSSLLSFRLGITLCALALLLLSCTIHPKPQYFSTGDMEIIVHPGEEWLHKYNIFLFISKMNPPQYAIWAEDLNGNYLQTIFVTAKTAKDSWKFNDDNRPESLPVWSNKADKAALDLDAVSSATPSGEKIIQLNSITLPDTFYLFMEVNHSEDYNSSYPKDIENQNAPGYSGGKGGSGQPALVYSTHINKNALDNHYTMELQGHSNPGGLNGDINPDCKTVTSALSIIDSCEIQMQ